MTDRRQSEHQEKLDIDRRKNQERRIKADIRQKLQHLYDFVYQPTYDPNSSPTDEDVVTALTLAVMDRQYQAKKDLAEFAKAMIRQGFICEDEEGLVISAEDLISCLEVV